MKEVEDEKYAICKKSYMEKVQHEKSASWKDPPWKECNMKRVQHKKSEKWK